ESDAALNHRRPRGAGGLGLERVPGRTPVPSCGGEGLFPALVCHQLPVLRVVATDGAQVLHSVLGAPDLLTAMAVHDLYLRVGSTSARRVVAGLASAVVAVIF